MVAENIHSKIIFNNSVLMNQVVSETLSSNLRIYDIKQRAAYFAALF